MKESTITGWTCSIWKSAPGRICLRIHHRPGEEQWVDAALAYWDGRLPGLMPVPSSTAASVYRGRIAPDGPEYFFKRYLLRGWLDWVKLWLRDSRAHRALINGEMIERFGFRAPRPVCMIEECHHGRTLYSGLVTEAVADAPSLRDWLNQPELGVAGSRERKRSLLEACGAEVGRWHAAGLHHGDMRIGNILVRRHGDGFLFHWLDNERTLHFTPLPDRQRARNLMQLNMEKTGVSLTDRMRFWRAYVRAADLEPVRADELRRQVVDWTRARWRKRGWL